MNTPKSPLEVYDATTRDGAQAKGVRMSVQDKLWFAERDDQLGIDFVEAGYPLSNETDIATFERLKEEQRTYTKVAAFGMTRRKGRLAEDDAGMKALLEAKPDTYTVVGKSSAFQVEWALHTTVEENRRMIVDSLQYLRDRGIRSGQGQRLIYDAEHFFDAMEEDPDHALSTLQAAVEGGADTLVLCDTNGGTFPDEISEYVAGVRQQFPDVRIGIHCHNDRDMATANTMAAVHAGATHLQGTWNGIGERCGNADLVPVLKNLLDRGYDFEGFDHVEWLTKHAREVYRVLHMPRRRGQAFVSEEAFYHKGGMHASAVERNPQCYECTDPASVGNHRIIAGSQQSGISNVRGFMKSMPLLTEELRVQLQESTDLQRQVLARVKKLEAQGYNFELAPESLELLVVRQLNAFTPKFRRIKQPRIDGEVDRSYQARIRIALNGNGKERFEVAEGDGPVHALSNALHKALIGPYPCLENVRIADFDVNQTSDEGADSVVQVVIQFTDQKSTWTTMGAGRDILGAAWVAINDGVEYKLASSARADDFAQLGSEHASKTSQ